MLAGAVGIWLFYVQHQFEDTYWQRTADWRYADAALHGSSYLKLPKVLQFFTGNIGLHHVHHLNARIPNYNLQRAHDENADLPQRADAVAVGRAAGDAAEAVGRARRAPGAMVADAVRASGRGRLHRVLIRILGGSDLPGGLGQADLPPGTRTSTWGCRGAIAPVSCSG